MSGLEELTAEVAQLKSIVAAIQETLLNLADDDYPGDSKPSPKVTKEQLDLELDQIATQISRRSGQSRPRHTLDFHDFMLLNTLACAYHAGFGYDSEEAYASEESDLIVLAATAFPEIATCEEIGESRYSISIDLTEAKKAAKECELHHIIVILRLCPRGGSGWESKPNPVKRTCFDHFELPEPLDWYQLPARPHKCGAGPFVGPLSGRSYIHVIDPYDEIEIRSEEKGEPITIDDILFASRGLCCGPDRSVNNFSVLSDDGSTLILRAEIDNLST